MLGMVRAQGSELGVMEGCQVFELGIFLGLQLGAKGGQSRGVVG